MSKKILTLDNVPVINKKIGKIDTIEKLKASTIYSIGDVVEVLGFHTKGDGSHHKRVAKGEDDGSGELGQNGIWWCIVHSGEVNVSWFGAKGDGVTDDTSAIQKALNFVDAKYINLDCKNFYNLTSMSTLSNGVKCCVSFFRNDIVLKSNGKRNSNMTFVYNGGDILDTVLYFEGRYVTIEELHINANSKSSRCIYNRVFGATYSPYLNMKNSSFSKAIECCVDLESYVSMFDNIVVNGFDVSELGFRYTGIGTEPVTSTVFNSCYVQRCKTGYNIKNMTYGTLNSCCVDLANLAFKLENLYGVALNGCGCESSLKGLELSAFRGVSINSFFGLSVGSTDSLNPTNYIMELIGGSDLTVSGFAIQNPSQRYYTYKAGLTSTSDGREFIHILDGSIIRSEFYFLETSYRYKKKAVKFSTDIITNTYSTTVNTTDELNTEINKLKNREVLAKVTVNLNAGNYGLVRIHDVNGDVELVCSDGVVFTYLDIRRSNVTINGLRVEVGGGAYNHGISLTETSKLFLNNSTITNTGNAGAGVFSSGKSSIVVNNSYVNGIFSFQNLFKAYHDNDNSTVYEFKNITLKERDWLPENLPVCVLNSDMYIVVCRLNSYYGHSSNSWEVINSKTSIANLDTPYYAYKMQEQGIYEDYIAYRDELHEYESLQESVSEEVMLMPVIQEPAIPENVREFAEKYKLI